MSLVLRITADDPSERVEEAAACGRRLRRHRRLDVGGKRQDRRLALGRRAGEAAYHRGFEGGREPAGGGGLGERLGGLGEGRVEQLPRAAPRARVLPREDA